MDFLFVNIYIYIYIYIYISSFTSLNWCENIYFWVKSLMLFVTKSRNENYISFSFLEKESQIIFYFFSLNSYGHNLVACTQVVETLFKTKMKHQMIPNHHATGSMRKLYSIKIVTFVLKQEKNST